MTSEGSFELDGVGEGSVPPGRQCAPAVALCAAVRLVQRHGTIPASPEYLWRAQARDAALLVYPGRDHETYRPSWQSGEIGCGGRTGFIDLAIAHDTIRVLEPIDLRAQLGPDPDPHDGYRLVTDACRTA